jgi:hypothetical protein
MDLRRITAVLIGVPLLVLACYRPDILQGGFKCASGDVCPDGFHCASNHFCYSGDAGPEVAACVSPPPTATCSTGPISPQACNPNCQTGCECGFCTVANGATICQTVAAGSNDIGDVCDPTTVASCKAGLFCRPECQTTNPPLGRCYKFCASDSDCQSQNTLCGANGSSAALTFKLCNLPNQQCNPVGATSGCPTDQGVFACYATSSGQTSCDCQGTATANMTCIFPSDCLPGYNCVSAQGMQTCQPTCGSSSDCTLPATCNQADPNSYGYCGIAI